MIADFRDLLAAFVANEVRFLVVGAHALAVHGVPRTTGDIDLWVEPTPANAAHVWRALGAFGAPLDTLGISEADFQQADQVVQLGLPPYRIDIMTSLSGLDFEQGWSGRVTGDLFDVAVAFIGRDALILNKRASARPKDLEDVRALEGRSTS